MTKKGVVITLFLALILLAGYYGLAQIKEKAAEKASTVQGMLPYDSGTVVPEGVDFSLPVLSTPVTTSSKINITLYFVDSSGLYLVPVTRQVPTTVGVARAAMQELAAGPESGSDVLPTIPAGASLRDINLRPDGLAIVDWNKELATNHAGGTNGEMMTVYSIVNTLTQFPTVKTVQLLIDGQYRDTLAGHLDISQPLDRNDSLIMPK